MHQTNSTSIENIESGTEIEKQQFLPIFIIRNSHKIKINVARIHCNLRKIRKTKDVIQKIGMRWYFFLRLRRFFC